VKTIPDNFPQEIIPDLISYLKSLQRKGIKSIYLDTSSESKTAPPATRDSKQENTDVPMESKTSTASAAERLSALDDQVKKCTECALHKGRTNTVFGKGNPATRVMFIGEGPGREEDLRGEPFVGRSGQLLTKMIEAIDLSRDDVYITNIVKCRPPENRDPQEDEVRCCEKYLAAQIDAIKPRIICALGRVSAHWLLDTKASLGSLRQSDNAYHGTPVLVTYHPAALLRNPGLKKGAWEDFKRLRSIINE
jgi:uracil-DNA glycosylase family 4